MYVKSLRALYFIELMLQQTTKLSTTQVLQETILRKEYQSTSQYHLSLSENFSRVLSDKLIGHIQESNWDCIKNNEEKLTYIRCFTGNILCISCTCIVLFIILRFSGSLLGELLLASTTSCTMFNLVSSMVRLKL